MEDWERNYRACARGALYLVPFRRKGSNPGTRKEKLVQSIYFFFGLYPTSLAYGAIVVSVSLLVVSNKYGEGSSLINSSTGI